MDKLGYIKNISEVVKKLGGDVEEVIPLLNSSNELNPTACFVIKPPASINQSKEIDSFSIPGTDYLVEFSNGCYYSKDTGLAFPILDDIPIFKTSNAILASKLDE